MPEKCALSHGSGVLGRDPRDSCRFWSPHVGNVFTVTQIRLGEGAGGGGDTIGGGVGEPRTGIIYTTIMELGPKRPSPLWFLGPNSIVVVYMDPLGMSKSLQGSPAAETTY